MRPDSSTITRERFDAVLFDLDGVLTDTAKVHAVCWKAMFDELLEHRTAHGDEPFTPFDIDEDYKLYVDGKPRYDGVRSFLASRDIDLPQGDTDAEAGFDTVCGLGNRKDELVHVELAEQGVEAYEGSVALVRRLREDGIKTAVVSSSHNCAEVLHSAGIAELFDARIDGEVSARLGLPGKPAPDTFLEAARRLSAERARCVVVEDAISGVQAGRAGEFGLVVGVDRKGDPESLRANGADIVVHDLRELLR
jgi:alpha,alpha-trehalase